VTVAKIPEGTDKCDGHGPPLQLKTFGLRPASPSTMSFFSHHFTNRETPMRDETICARPMRH
jgi:hypothetical protein